MITTNIAMTEQIPSSIGMPVYGRALGAAVGAHVCVQTTTVVLGAPVAGMGRRGRAARRAGWYRDLPRRR